MVHEAKGAIFPWASAVFTTSTTATTNPEVPLSTTTTASPSPTSTTTAPPAPLDWDSPAAVTSGVPVHVASVSPCPPPPTPGDAVLVQVWVGQTGPNGWAANQLLDANRDGSWSGDVTFSFNGPTGPASIGASCDDSFGSGSNPYADYQTRDVQLSSPPTS